MKRPKTGNYSIFLDDEDQEDVMTVNEYLDCVDEGGFIDYDGYGYAVSGNQYDRSRAIYPSDHNAFIPLDATHVYWLNR